jgi:uncharacterized membrane protein
MFGPGFWQTIANWPLAQYIAASSWAFPTIETIHVIAIVTVIGSIVVVDLRLLGLASPETSVTQITNDTLPLTWGAFAIAFITGSLLFISKASDYAVNPFFWWKMAMIVAAGLNMGVFHLVTWRSVDKWNFWPIAPLGARIAGGLSLFLWILVAFLGRAIGFTLDKFSG